MIIKKTRKENQFLKRKKKPKEKGEEPTILQRVPSLRPPKWHPVNRKEKSLVTELAEAVGEELHLEDYEMSGVELANAVRLDTYAYGYKVSEAELEQMRRVAFS